MPSYPCRALPPLFVAALVMAQGCILDRGGTAPLDGMVRDGGDAGIGCPTGTVDLDEDASNGCECTIVAESCNNVDDNCDGRVDEFVTRACGAMGACAGVETCNLGVFLDCELPSPLPDEVCDGVLDENCDGVVDEGCACSPSGTEGECGITDVGSCGFGTRTCLPDGTWGECTGSVGPGAEVCDGSEDENCDGMVDEGCECVIGMMDPCGSDVGACVPGNRTCSVDGIWGVCMGATGPRSEVCEGMIDENCDGVADDGCECTIGDTQGCGTDVGECSFGRETCGSDGRWDPATCTGGTGPATEVCDGSDDENCDGDVDEGCGCTMGETMSCGTDVGECTFGSRTCTSSGDWPSGCMGGRTPRSESCDGTDEDCNGTVDDDSSADCEMATGCHVVRVAGGTYLACEGGSLNRDWAEARDFCRSVGDYELVTIDDAAEDSALRAAIDPLDRGDYWIGYNDENDDGRYRWVGEPPTGSYVNWRGGTPGDEKCAVLDTRTAGWEAPGCGGDKRFICEAPPS